MKRGDFVLIALAILLALTPLLLRPARGAAPRAVVRKDGEIAAELPLDEDAVLRLEEGGQNVLRVSGGAIRMEEADCPDGTCVRQGAIQSPGETIVCLPHRVTVTIVGNDEGTGGVDAVVQ